MLDPLRRCVAFTLLLVALARTLAAAEPPAAASLFRRENLIAWCIVPFDAKKRGPEERAAMLEKLGFSRFAYDWRAEHLPTLDAEIAALKKHKVGLDAVWFPGSLNADARTILDALKRHNIKTQLWVTGGGAATTSPEEQQARIAAEVRRLQPIAEEAAKIGCTVGLYNHGGWYGEPENQLAILKALNLPNVGIVYNQHHGHDHLDRFPQLLAQMKPHLLALNLNGMVRGGDKGGQKILPLGQGDLDLALLKTIRESGYRGPIGILGHTQDDAEARLQDNLDGLDWLVPQLDGKPAGPKPQPRTMKPRETAAAAGGARGWLIDGRPEYRTPPLTLECRARITDKQGYNILVACDTKSSGDHWELFTMPTSGQLTAYLPGSTPDHVRSTVDVCDGQPHTLALLYEPTRAQLVVDGKVVAEQVVKSKQRPGVPDRLAIGRLVEGGIGSTATIDTVRLSRGLRALDNLLTSAAPVADEATLGLWRLEGVNADQVDDLSKRKNPARLAAGAAVNTKSPLPPPGVHLAAADPRIKVTLIDRSADNVYMAVKVDNAGRLFVGGREAVFVFEPDGQGGFLPKQELLPFPQDSIIIGLELRGDDLYVMTSHALYLVPQGRVRREGLKAERLLWGLPLDLHVSFHCLAWGPEGDLYLNHGDPLLQYGDWSRPDHWGHWTLFAGRDNKPYSYTGAGAVLRMRPDGSNLQVVAGGLRGPVGLAFDPRWRLFTNDNDHESRADQYAPIKLLHVTPHVDFGWPRGWMASKSPERFDLLEPMSATLGRGVPCDLAWYDEPLLGDVVKDRLLMCRWDRHAVTSYKLRPRGASVEADESVLLTGSENARPVGVTIDRAGRLFVSSLYLTGNVASPYCASDIVMVTSAANSTPLPVEPDVATLPDDKLYAELSRPSWEARRRAHHELLRRGGAALASATERLNTIDDRDPALTHLVWLAGTSSDDKAAKRIRELARRGRPELRELAVRVLAEFPQLTGSKELDNALFLDGDPGVRLATLSLRASAAEEELTENAWALAHSDDTYLRQTAVRLLARLAKTHDLQMSASSRHDETRLAAVLAIGTRLTVPPVDDVPPTPLALFYPKESSFFKASLKFADAAEPVDLKSLGRIGSYTTAERWKVTASYSSSIELFPVLLRAADDPDQRVALQAAWYLSLLKDPRSEPVVAQTRNKWLLRRLEEAPRQVVERAWLAGPFDDGGQGFGRAHPPEQGNIDLTAEYAATAGKITWREGALAAAPGADASTYALATLQSRARQPALVTLDTPGEARVWHNGRAVEPNSAASAAGRIGFVLDLQPGTNDLLIRFRSYKESNVALSLAFRAKEGVTAALAERLDSGVLAQRLKEAAAGGAATALSAEFVSLDWTAEALRGDASQGRKLFGSLGCAKCHAVVPEQAGGGAPSLSEARRRFTVPHLVESILLPSKQVAEPFRGTTIVTADGLVISGLVVSESAELVELLLPDGSRRALAQKEIDEQTRTHQSPMPQGIVKAPAELRALLAYLLSDRPLPP